MSITATDTSNLFLKHCSVPHVSPIFKFALFIVLILVFILYDDSQLVVKQWAVQPKLWN
ncbi:hypothetical protein [Dolichospermum flos-aquae]|nr:hypothetical protein [Dolichospermum flos-aquae]